MTKPNFSRQAEWRRNNPDAWAAHKAVNNAIRAGLITKPSECELCGVTAKLDGHHPHHKDRLRVIFLCRSCHVRLHNRPGFPVPRTAEAG